MTLFDTNVWFGSWPFAPIGIPSAAALEKRLGSNGIEGALVSSFETVFQVDPMPGNRALRQALRKRKSLQALPVINPGTPAWEDHFEELATSSDVPALRLLPSYHDYRLNSKSTQRLVRATEANGVRLVITARLVDERQEHKAVNIKPVSVEALTDFVQKHPQLNPLIQGLNRHEVEALSKAEGQFLTDTSFAEWEDTLKVLKGFLPVSRMLFGSLTPLHVLQAQVDKIRCSSLTDRQRQLVASGNAKNYFGL